MILAQIAKQKHIMAYLIPLFILEMQMQKYRILSTLYKKELYNFLNFKKRVTFAVGFADMAQLVEQRIRNAWVRGSSPLIGS